MQKGWWSKHKNQQRKENPLTLLVINETEIPLND